MDIDQDGSHKFVFTVSVESYGKGDERHRQRIAAELDRLVRRGFGQRVVVASEKRPLYVGPQRCLHGKTADEPCSDCQADEGLDR